MIDYNAIAIAKVEKDKTPIMAIPSMGSNEIRRLCGVPTKGCKNPPGFSPRKVRNALIARLPVIRRRKIQERRRSRLEELIRREAGEDKTTVALDEQDRFILTKPEVF